MKIYRRKSIALWYNSKARFGDHPEANLIIICSSDQLWLGALHTSLASGGILCPQDLENVLCVLISKSRVPPETLSNFRQVPGSPCRPTPKLDFRGGVFHPPPESGQFGFPLPKYPKSRLFRVFPPKPLKMSKNDVYIRQKSTFPLKSHFSKAKSHFFPLESPILP